MEANVVMSTHDTYRIALSQDETYRGFCNTWRMEKPADRLRRAREARRYATPTEAAEAFGWNEVTYRAHENGGRGIKPAVAEKYAKALRVSPAWLMYGDGEPPETDSAPQPKPYEPEPNAIFEGRTSLPYPTNIRDVEELGLTMGGDGEDDSVFEFNGQVIDRVMRPQGLLNRKNVFALRVANSSMSPRFEEGDRIYVERMDAPAIGDYVVIELKPPEDGRPGKSFIKRLVKREAGILTVEQFNPAGYLEFGRREVLRMFRVFTQRELLGE